MSMLDGFSGYNQVLVVEEDRAKKDINELKPHHLRREFNNFLARSTLYEYLSLTMQVL
jgi:hypothetical protein